MELQPIDEAIIIHPHLLRKFMKHEKDYANLLALYSFYLYHAQLQKTNQPLATDEFTRKGMNWAIDRVKKTKKILKEMKVIEVVQHRKYYYIHLFFIYTKSRVDKILEVCKEKFSAFANSSKPEVKDEKEKRVIKRPIEATKKKKPISKPKASTPSRPIKTSTPAQQVSPLLNRWLEYCNKSHISYTKSNINYWENKLKNRLTIEKETAVYTAIKRGWKDFYIPSIKESKYHKFLGRSVRLDQDCHTLLDISYRNERYVYQFKNARAVTTGNPEALFKRFEYIETDSYLPPIASKIKDSVKGMIQRF
jgi:hypothetical protein